MAQKYNPHEIEAKWRSTWPKARDSYKLQSGDEPYYVLDMISYPSSEGLHMGHWRPYTIADVWARYNTLLGKKVLSPVGFDAFGLPAENAAIKNNRHPDDYTKQSMSNFTRQIQEMGKMYDWSTLINTSSPEYYKWTQWIFVQLYKHGLAYKKAAAVWWCPKDQTVLANEQVVSGECERCGTEVIRKNLSQWFFKITDFAEDLLSFEGLNWPERVKTLQTNWIGKSQGAQIDFIIDGSDERITVFTTRPDTLFGVTYIVVAPEHPLAMKLARNEYAAEVSTYIQEASKKTDIDRMAEDRPKTGVFTGSYAIHPLTNEKVPVWVADYVIGTYGTGAVMGVPAHDMRDFVFAMDYKLRVLPVIWKQDVPALSYLMGAEQITDAELMELDITIVGTEDSGSRKLEIPIGKVSDYQDLIREKLTPGYWNEVVSLHGAQFIFRHADGSIQELDLTPQTDKEIDSLAAQFSNEATSDWPSSWNWLAKNDFYRGYLVHEAYGSLMNSGEFNGSASSEAKEKIVEQLAKRNSGHATTNYRLRDWLISRQRYWGAPIPIVYCEKCGEQAVPDEQLPVLLPKDVEFLPTGGSPLERHPQFKHAACPSCGGEATRETDTLDTFVDSSWYYLRYVDPNNTEAAFTEDQVKAWLPVDFYVGGTEHSILHLLYARFVMKSLHRLGHVPYHEPFQTFFGNGMVYLNGKKMSKSKGNIVNPDDMVKRYGVDAMRGYILFMGPADQDVEWQENGITGVSRFLDKAWQIFSAMNVSDSNEAISPAIQKAYGDVTTHLQSFTFNRCISSLMIALNELGTTRLNRTEAEVLIRLFAPFFPHFAEEIWSELGHTTSIFASTWPDVTVDAAQSASYVIQVNGKLRATLQVPVSALEPEVIALARDLPAVQSHLEGMNVEKTIFVAGRIVNFVVR